MLAHSLPEDFSPEEAQISGTILCVDDESQILKSLKRVFRRAGHDTVIFTSAAEALEYLQENTVDLIISDMRMPEMDGNKFLSEAASQWPNSVRMLLTGYSDLDSMVGAINNGHIYRYISKPWDETDLLMSIQRALETKRLKDEHTRLNKLTDEQNIKLQALNSSLEERVAKRTEDLKKANTSLHNAYADSVAVFARIIGMREGESAAHGERIAELAERVAVHMKLDDQQRQDIQYAALLHDIGKIGLPDTLLQTPYESQSDEQREQYQQHSVNGEAVLMSLGPLESAASIIRSHHERINGSGFPDGLKGEDIPLGARILNVVNEHDDLLSGALLGRQLDAAAANSYLEAGSGIRYDPNVVAAFLAISADRTQSESIRKELVLSIDDVKPGMVLAQDIYLRENVLMLRSGQVLTESFIKKFKTLRTDSKKMSLLKVCT